MTLVSVQQAVADNLVNDSLEILSENEDKGIGLCFLERLQDLNLSEQQLEIHLDKYPDEDLRKSLLTICDLVRLNYRTVTYSWFGNFAQEGSTEQGIKQAVSEYVLEKIHKHIEDLEAGISSDDLTESKNGYIEREQKIAANSRWRETNPRGTNSSLMRGVLVAVEAVYYFHKLTAEHLRILREEGSDDEIIERFNASDEEIRNTAPGYDQHGDWHRPLINRIRRLANIISDDYELLLLDWGQLRTTENLLSGNVGTTSRDNQFDLSPDRLLELIARTHWSWRDILQFDHIHGEFSHFMLRGFSQSTRNILMTSGITRVQFSTLSKERFVLMTKWGALRLLDNQLALPLDALLTFPIDRLKLLNQGSVDVLMTKHGLSREKLLDLPEGKLKILHQINKILDFVKTNQGNLDESFDIVDIDYLLDLDEELIEFAGSFLGNQLLEKCRITWQQMLNISKERMAILSMHMSIYLERDILTGEMPLTLPLKNLNILSDIYASGWYNFIFKYGMTLEQAYKTYEDGKFHQLNYHMSHPIENNQITLEQALLLSERKYQYFYQAFSCGLSFENVNSMTESKISLFEHILSHDQDNVYLHSYLSQVEFTIEDFIRLPENKVEFARDLISGNERDGWRGKTFQDILTDSIRELNRTFGMQWTIRIFRALNRLSIDQPEFKMPNQIKWKLYNQLVCDAPNGLSKEQAELFLNEARSEAKRYYSVNGRMNRLGESLGNSMMNIFRSSSEDNNPAGQGNHRDGPSI